MPLHKSASWLIPAPRIHWYPGQSRTKVNEEPKATGGRAFQLTKRMNAQDREIMEAALIVGDNSKILWMAPGADRHGQGQKGKDARVQDAVVRACHRSNDPPHPAS